MTKSTFVDVGFQIQAEATVGGNPVDLGELKRSLRTVADTQSITHAANMLGVTYRTLWGRLLAFDDALNCKLTGKSRGRGTNLTGKGRALLAALERHGELFTPPTGERVSALAADLAQALREQPLLRLHASHDYAIARVFARLGTAVGKGVAAVKTPAVEIPEAIHLSNSGSVDCIRALLRGDADLAGYHHVSRHASASGDASNSPWHRVETGDDYWSVALMEREQGLIVSPRLKAQVKTIADLTRDGLRFVNRQRGSGTRVLFDALLADANMIPARINGYEQEEFTHQAVAATIAAGAADAGPGLRAAAAQFNLHFVPLATEIYRLAGRADSRDQPAVTSLIAAIRKQAATLPGYKALR